MNTAQARTNAAERVESLGPIPSAHGRGLPAAERGFMHDPATSSAVVRRALENLTLMMRQSGVAPSPR